MRPTGWHSCSHEHRCSVLREGPVLLVGLPSPPPDTGSVNHHGVLSWLTNLFCWYDLETIHFSGPPKLPCISIVLATH